MRHQVVNSRLALKQLRKAPAHVAAKLNAWVELVETEGMAVARKIPGYHDEALKGMEVNAHDY